MVRANLPAKDQFKGKIVKDYCLEEEVGRGNIGVVYRSHHKDVSELKSAIKFIPKGNLKEKVWQKELQKLGLLTGIKEVIQYKHHGADILDGTLYAFIESEFINGPNLREYAQKNTGNITLPFIECLIEQILNAFIAMEVENIAHGDLHEGNILIAYDDRLPDPNRPVVKIGDFGIGGSHVFLKPKDDYVQLALICHNLLEKYIDPSKLAGGDRYFYDKLTEEFLPKKILENNKTVGDFVREPRKLLDCLKDIRENYKSESIQLPVMLPLKNPFDYLSCEEMGDSFEVLQTLYSKNFPGYDDLLQRTNTILTGPRGCGKTTIFRNLSLKTQLLGGKKRIIDELDDYIGIYYHSSDLYFAFPYLKEKISEIYRRVIINFFNLAIFYEFLDTLSVAQDYIKGINNTYNLDEIESYINKCMPSYRRTLSGVSASVLRNMSSFVTTKKEEIKAWLISGHPEQPPKPFLPLDFIKNVCQIFIRCIPWLKGRAIYFFLDDYSLPRISKPIQETLHDFILHRYADCFFKISTESIVTFYPYDSKGKLLEETREYDVVDLGAHFLHSPKEVKDAFLAGVINSRLENTKGIYSDFQDITKVLGRSERAYNQLAREIRETGKRVHYYGWDMVVDLCSGDVVNILRLIRDIISLSGGPEKFLRLSNITIPLEKQFQDRAIRELGNDFLNRIEAVPDNGKELRNIANAFGEVANWYLRNRNSKNEEQQPPWQAFRLEVRDTPYFEDSLLKEAKKKYNINDAVSADKLEKLYKELIRYGIFIRDVRGKSQRGAVIPRLYLRRLLIPTFLLTPNARDSIGIEVGEFFMLLSNPDDFISHMKGKKVREKDKNQGKIF